MSPIGQRGSARAGRGASGPRSHLRERILEETGCTWAACTCTRKDSINFYNASNRRHRRQGKGRGRVANGRERVGLAEQRVPSGLHRCTRPSHEPRLSTCHHVQPHRAPATCSPFLHDLLSWINHHSFLPFSHLVFPPSFRVLHRHREIHSECFPSYPYIPSNLTNVVIPRVIIMSEVEEEILTGGKKTRKRNKKGKSICRDGYISSLRN